MQRRAKSFTTPHILYNNVLHNDILFNDIIFIILSDSMEFSAGAGKEPRFKGVEAYVFA